MVAYVYMLRCSDGSLYVGSTRLLHAREFQHQLGMGAAYTRKRLPVELVWHEEHEHVAAPPSLGRSRSRTGVGRSGWR